MPVCPMALLVFINFFTELQALGTSAWTPVKKSMETRSAVWQTGKAPSNPLN